MPQPAPTLQLTLLQFNVRLGRPDINLERVRTWISARPRPEICPPEVILLPELWGSGYAYTHLAAQAAATPGLLQATAELAREQGVWLGGSLIEAHENHFYNTFYLHSPNGERIAAYRKIHLFSLMDENRWFQAGAEPCLIEIGGRKTGLMTCYDLRFPELARHLALAGAEMLLICAQWPRPRTAHWTALLKARALENQLFVAGCNRIGKGPLHHYPGASAIYGPWGETVLKTPKRGGAFGAVINFTAVAKARAAIPCLADRRPEAYRVP